MNLPYFRTASSCLHNNVIEILETLLDGIHELLKEDVIGVYLRGSLALGDFDPETSDIDYLAVMKNAMTDERFTLLKGFHSQLANLHNPYAKHLEGAYIDLNSLKRFQTGKYHPTIYRGEDLKWSEHHMNWIIERWTIREHGITLIGPDPKKLIDRISVEEIQSAVLERLRDWVNWANQSDDPEWHLPLSHKAYVVETMCRIMFTLSCGNICSKKHAVVWALEIFPEPWRSLVEKSMAWRTKHMTSPDADTISKVMSFVHWVAFKAGL
ncbi:hypothetical protein WQ54_07200 [Bacillus sp. SA1-12]|uniref:aminoglycoside adenylyltransferase domain-containing protein n=1 Tax=Bacillus sp. SA1-12 TaxID=1455638 RepID=UPI000626149A|nr:aminoglycoside adenylyltransferase domain-containing protein [Bacillus sp. SA1-12]KKI92953.1 hypothetical protein WQ54_07200 [Bacillus sp. SA1-12]